MLLRATATSLVPPCLAFLLLVNLAVSAPPKPSLEERLKATQSQLKSEDVETRRGAIGTLVHSDLSPKMLAEMRAALHDDDGVVRSTAATAIGNLRTEAVDAVPELIAQLEGDPVKEARETAARALGRIGESTASERRPVEPLTKASQADRDPVTRIVATGALAMMQIEREGQIDRLRTFLHDTEPLVRMKASHALGMLGKDARRASAEIAAAFQTEPDAHRRGYVARAIGNVGDPAALPVLLSAYERETDKTVLGEIRGAIGKLGGKVEKK